MDRCFQDVCYCKVSKSKNVLSETDLLSSCTRPMVTSRLRSFANPCRRQRRISLLSVPQEPTTIRLSIA